MGGIINISLILQIKQNLEKVSNLLITHAKKEDNWNLVLVPSFTYTFIKYLLSPYYAPVTLLLRTQHWKKPQNVRKQTSN